MWHLGRLDVDGLGSQADREWVRGIVLQRLIRTPQMDVSPAPRHKLAADRLPPPVRLRVQLMDGGLQLTLSPEDSFGPELEALVPLAGYALGAQAIDEGVEHALQAVVAMVEADRAGPEALRRLIEAEPQGLVLPLGGVGRHNVRSFAVRRVAQLRDVAAAPALRKLVARAAREDAPVPDQALGLQAVGSLMALCDRAAVLPMIDLTRHKEADFVVQMAHAVAAVGGPMAEAYLVTLASGHLDDEVRQGAAQALVDLQQRKSKGRGCPP